MTGSEIQILNFVFRRFEDQIREIGLLVRSSRVGLSLYEVNSWGVEALFQELPHRAEPELFFAAN